jgi:hypothetical protein
MQSRWEILMIKHLLKKITAEENAELAQLVASSHAKKDQFDRFSSPDWLRQQFADIWEIDQRKLPAEEFFRTRKKK